MKRSRLLKLNSLRTTMPVSPKTQLRASRSYDDVKLRMTREELTKLRAENKYLRSVMTGEQYVPPQRQRVPVYEACSSVADAMDELSPTRSRVGGRGVSAVEYAAAVKSPTVSPKPRRQRLLPPNGYSKSDIHIEPGRREKARQMSSTPVDIFQQRSPQRVRVGQDGGRAGAGAGMGAGGSPHGLRAGDHSLNGICVNTRNAWRLPAVQSRYDWGYSHEERQSGLLFDRTHTGEVIPHWLLDPEGGGGPVEVRPSVALPGRNVTSHLQSSTSESVLLDGQRHRAEAAAVGAAVSAARVRAAEATKVAWHGWQVGCERWAGGVALAALSPGGRLWLRPLPWVPI